MLLYAYKCDRKLWSWLNIQLFGGGSASLNANAVFFSKLYITGAMEFLQEGPQKGQS